VCADFSRWHVLVRSPTDDKCSKCDARKVGERCYRGLILHDLRRTGIRKMIRRGVPEPIAMQISGHKTVSVFRRYNITSEEDKQTAAKLIEAARRDLKVTNGLHSKQEPEEAAVN
jgi:hypothetical protein